MTRQPWSINWLLPDSITSSAAPALRKSLLLSTLEAYFQGKKELFEGLAMEKLEKEWTKHPILHFDLNISHYDAPDSLYKILNDTLSRYEEEYGTRPTEETLPLRFAGIIDRAYRKTGQRAVILIDEYDKPLLQNLHDEEMQNRFRNMLKPFYGVLKTMDRAIRFALLTGVTKFGKVSVFSDLNNLDDISMREPYAAICGITETELRTHFDEDIHTLASALERTYEEARSLLRKRYDGYHFVAGGPGIYNPFSLLNTFKYMRLSDYWFETGTPTYLVELLKRTNYDLYDMANTETDADVLNSIDSASNNPIPVIYQSGYLTIKDYEPEFKIYRLGFPNQEVEEGFMKYLLPFYTNIQASKSPFEIGRFVREVRAGDYDAFFHRLQGFFADTSYEAIIGRNPERDTERITETSSSSSSSWSDCTRKWNTTPRTGASTSSCKPTATSISWSSSSTEPQRRLCGRSTRKATPYPSPETTGRS